MDDAALLAAYAGEKSEEAFQELVRRHVGLVYALCRRQLRDAHLAEDVTQAVFVLLARKGPELSKEVVLGGWLYKTAFYACSNARDLKRTRSYHEARVKMMDEIPKEPDPVERAEMQELLDNALMELPKAQREILVLRFFQNKTVKEVAKARKQSLYATQKSMDAGLAKLRRFLSQRGVSVTAAVAVAALAEESAKAIPAGLAAKVGHTALQGTAALSGRAAELVAEIVRHWTRTKFVASFATLAACVLLGFAGLTMGGTFLRGTGQGNRAEMSAALSPAEQSREIDALWQQLRETDRALRQMDVVAISHLVSFGDADQMRQWDVMAQVFAGNLALQQTAAAKFGEEGKRLTAIQTFGERLDTVLPAVNKESCQWEVHRADAVLHFAYRDARVEGGSLYFVKDQGTWRIDAGRSLEIALEGLTDDGKRDAVAKLAEGEQQAVFERMASLEEQLRHVREAIENGNVRSVADARAALAQSGTDQRAFFHLALRASDREEARN